MMFEAFESSYVRDNDFSVLMRGNVQRSSMADWDSLIERFGGSSFNHGVYRVIRSADVSRWSARVAWAFPEIGKRALCFGFDWLGRVFAADPMRIEEGKPGVVMFEPGTGGALEVPCNIETFHDRELLENADAALASGFHREWILRGAMPNYEQCVGYKKPLFFGGSDDLSNLELSDIDVYWHIMAQLIEKTRGLPLGTPINIGLS